jgi:hypothetical protein
MDGAKHFDSFDLPEPHFAIIGPADDPMCNDLLVTLIHAGANPQSWGDRKPPKHLFEKASNIFFDGKSLQIESNYKGKWEDLVGIQSYHPRLPDEQLEELLDLSKWIYCKDFRNDTISKEKLCKSFPKPPKLINKEQ